MAALLSAVLIISQGNSEIQSLAAAEDSSLIGSVSENASYSDSADQKGSSDLITDKEGSTDKTGTVDSNTDSAGTTDQTDTPDPSADQSETLAPTDTTTDQETSTDPIADTSDPEGDTPPTTDSVIPTDSNPLSNISETSSAIHNQLKALAIAHDEQDTLTNLTEGYDYAENEVIAYADSEAEAEEIAEAYGGQLTDFSFGVATISLADSDMTVKEALESAIAEDSNLPMIEPNYITYLEEPESESLLTSYNIMSAEKYIHTTDAFADRWWIDMIRDPYLNPDSEYYQWHHGMINTYSAWGVTTGSSDIVVAVIDSGVNSENIDLAGQIAAGGYDFIDNVETTENVKNDAAGHGTHVSGIIAASLNDLLGAGVAPGCKILPLRVVSTSSVKNDDVVRAVNYAIEADVDIINMSLGGVVYAAIVDQAMQRAYNAGITTVAAMGNDKNSNVVNYPAGCDHVIGVCSVNEEGNLSNFSTFGEWADISAPGSGIYSCSSSDTSGYRYDEGTSMASPVVAGACALYMSAVGHVDPDTMETVLKRSVSGSAGYDTGAGVLDLAKMFGGDTTAPSITLTAYDGENVTGSADDGDAYTISETTAENALLSITPMNYDGAETANTSTSIIYTTDGTTPSVSGGVATCGTLYEGPLQVKELFAPGTETKITIKAAAVTGMGVMSAVSTLVFTVDPEDTGSDIETAYTVSITNAPASLVAGKSIKLTALVESPDPYRSVSQKVTWSIDGYREGDLSGAKINASTGNLTTNASQTGILVVRCLSKETGATCVTEINVRTADPVSRLILNGGLPKKLTINSEGVVVPESDLILKVTTLTDISGFDLLDDDKSYENIGFYWKSSNTNVIEVKELEPSDEDPGAPAIKLEVKSAGSATITCRALDGSGKSASIKVTVTSSVKAASVKLSDSEGAALSRLTLFAGEESCTAVSRIEYLGTESINILKTAWKSSNNKVARVEADSENSFKAVIIPVAKGSATITCAATDGSGKKAAIKLTVRQHVTGLSIKGQSYISPGASAKYTASAIPSNANNKKVTWDISDEARALGITVNSGTGTVKVPKGIEAGTTFDLTATAKDGCGTSAVHTIEISPKATRLNAQFADGATGIIATNPKSGFSDTLRISAATDNNSALSFKTGNSKVAKVTAVTFDAETGITTATVQAVGKGSTRVTASATDGSGKSRYLKITVKELVSSVTVTGRKTIALGNRATFKADVRSKKASSRKVKWSLGDDSPEGVSISSGGVVTISKNASSAVGRTVTVTATAQDDSEESGSITFVIAAKKASGVSLDIYGPALIDAVHDPTYSKKGVLTSIRLYDTNIPDDDDLGENMITLMGEVSTAAGISEYTDLVWKSSKPSIAEVQKRENGTAVVTGISPGTSTITCTAGDGSGKKASVKVTVITPASGISIPAADGIYSDVYRGSELTFGASCRMPAVLGSVYGKPGITQVTWDMEIGTYSGRGNFTPLENSDEAVSAGLFFTFARGKFSVKDKSHYLEDLEKLGMAVETDEDIVYYSAKLTATTTDGTGYSTVRYVETVPPTTYIRMISNSKEIIDGKINLSSYLDEDGNLIQSKYYNAGVLEYDNAEHGLSVVSSDTKVATPLITKLSGNKVLLLFPKGRGTARITVTPLDGSPVKYEYTITVR